ncbi:MAG: TIGR04168 family protein [Elainellaceae cyanobacterium]
MVRIQPELENPPSQRNSQGRSLTIAVVGDVHNDWDATEDEAALRHLGVDLVLLVGDFGNEAVDVVRAIANLDLPKAVILGNHDAWYNATQWGRKKCPYDVQRENWVQQQLDLLGETHVGYSKLDFSDLNLTVVGGRPFSWGGSSWKHEDFYRDWYGVENFDESVNRIMAAVNDAAHETLIFIGHCGPSGLGDRPEDPCGRDWKPLGGDFGDPDLAEAIAQSRTLGKHIPLVTFGHMHHRLRHTKDCLRKMIDTDADNTVYLNAASVPRIIKTSAGERLRNFSLVTLEQGTVSNTSLVWVNQDFEIRSEHVLYQKSQPTAQFASI